MMYNRTVILVVTIALLFSGLSFAVQSNEATHVMASEGDYTVHDPIKIDSNSDFEDQANEEGWPGNGSQDDPYIIEGYEIDAGGPSCCIYIGNTTLYFIVRDCYLHGTDWIKGSQYQEACLNLEDVENGVLTNNTVSGNYEGIGIYSSQDNKITDNTVLDNKYGIKYTFSKSDVISGNTVSENGVGIYLALADDSLIKNNTLSGNDKGIHIDESRFLRLEENTMVDDGILIWGKEVSYWNTHEIDTSNTVNGKPVIYWKDKTNRTVPEGAGEVILANCNNVTIENQDIRGSYVGIELGYSDNNTIVDNTLKENHIGIRFFTSQWNEVSSNTLINNIKKSNYDLGWYNIGIQIDTSSYNIFSDNIIKDNNYGFDSWSSSENCVFNNTISSNQGYGIKLHSSLDNIFYHNNLIDNTAYDDSGENHWYNSTLKEGNYWSYYNGEDSDGDGIGDEPYTNIKGGGGSEDKYPLMGTYEVTPPKADAGEDRTVEEDTVVTFDASNSSDNVGIVSYTWTIEGIKFHDKSVRYIFEEPGIFSVKLKVTDKSGNHDTDIVNVTVLDTTPPDAVIGVDRTVMKNTSVEFNAYNSSDNVGIVNYTWLIDGQVMYGVKINYTFEELGTYRVMLNVSDEAGHINTTEIEVTVKNKTDSDAREDDKISVSVNENFTLDADNYTDKVGIEEYRWDFGDGKNVTGENVTYSYNEPGNYTVTLTMIYEDGNRDTVHVTINVEEGEEKDSFDMAYVLFVLMMIGVSLISLYWYRRGKDRRI